MPASHLNPQTHCLNPKLDRAVSATLEDWTREGKPARLWSGDAALWTGSDEGRWLGWLSLTDGPERSPHLGELAREVRQEGLSHLLLLGMGGSSLFPEVLAATFGKQQGYPELHVLDSTDPGQIHRFESANRPVPNALHRLQQVRRHPGTQYPERVFLRAGQAGLGWARSRKAVCCDHRPRVQAAGDSRKGWFPVHLFGGAGRGGPLLGAVELRQSAGSFDGAGCGRVHPTDPPDGGGLRRSGSRDPESRGGPGRHPGHPGQDRQGQAHSDHLPGNLGDGGLAGAVAGRVHREGRKGPHSGRRRVGGASRGLWRGPAVPPPSVGLDPRPGAGAGRPESEAEWTSPRPDLDGGPLRPRPGGL